MNNATKFCPDNCGYSLPFWKQSKSFILEKNAHAYILLEFFVIVKTLVQFFKAITYVEALKETKSGSGM